VSFCDGSPVEVWLNVGNLEDLFQRLNWVLARRWLVFVSHEPPVAQVSCSLQQEAVIQFLRLVDFVPARHSCGVKMTDQRQMGANIRCYVAIHDLNVINVEKNLDARGIHSRAHFRCPIDMIADRIRPAEGRIFVFAIDDLQ